MNKLFYLSLALLTLTAPLTFSQEVPEAENVPDYIQFEDDKLLTAVSRFEKDGNSVDLFAVIHVGDKIYFNIINQTLAKYDAVLYEMVGGPYSEEKVNAAKASGEMNQIQGMQKMVTNLLGLEFQLDQVNYKPDNFIHADMTAEQFLEQTDGGQILSSLIGKAMKLSQSGKLEGLPTSEADANKLMSSLLGAVMSGDSNELKRTFGPILAEAESLIMQLEGDEESVLIAKRNKIVIEALNNLEQKPGREDAIFYGAGHMPDLEKRLIKMGYTKTTTVWLPGWNIGESKQTEQRAPDLGQLLEQVGPLMEMLKENSK